MVLNAADVLGTDFLKDIYSMHFKTLISLMAGNKEIPAVQAAKIFTKIIEKIEVLTTIINISILDWILFCFLFTGRNLSLGTNTHNCTKASIIKTKSQKYEGFFR